MKMLVISLIIVVLLAMGIYLAKGVIASNCKCLPCACEPCEC